MSNDVMVVVASNFESFVGSLKSNLKLGYATCSEATYLNGFFRARLEKEADKSYVARLESISGAERENVLDLVDYLGGISAPVTQKLVTEVKEVLEVNEENKQEDALQTEAVTPKIEREGSSTRKPRARSKK